MCSNIHSSTGCGPFLQDLTNRDLVKIKLIYFISLSGMVMIWPWFSLQQEALGITKKDIGVMGALQAVTFIIVPFLAGMVGDKIGNFKILLSSMTLLSALSVALFTVVPPTVSQENASNNNLAGNGTQLTEDNNHTEFVEYTVEHSEEMNNLTLLGSLENDKASYAVTFWSYFIVKAIFSLTCGATFTLYDGAVMSQMQEKGIDYGKQRAWGFFANALAPLLGGLMVDYLTNKNYNIVFYCSSGLMVVASIMCLRLDLRYKAPATQLARVIFRQCLQPEMLLLLTALLFNGVFFGFIETYMYLYLGKLGASNALLGLTVTVNVPIEFLLQVTMTSIIQKIGHAAAIAIGTLGCSVRLLGLSFLTNPWYVLFLEVIEGIGNGFLVSAAIIYCSTLVTPSSIVSFRGIIGSTHMGFGSLIGSMAGGAISEKLGDRLTFRVMSAVALVVAIVYMMGYCAIVKFRRPNHMMNGAFSINPTNNDNDKRNGVFTAIPTNDGNAIMQR